MELPPPGANLTKPEEIEEALAKLNEGNASDSDFLMLLCHGKVLGLRRVEGDDGDKDQILRWFMGDPRDNGDSAWDVFKTMRKGEPEKYCCRYIGPITEVPNMMDAWKASYDLCK
eukprot:CAMPEP_0119300514 /NCGR_PEP_ID=MMETSP1333-20130426/2445_1 /TAXON_ID=418940 /ORGANISM="Scyphosphaera apsteinii, Strain RCC1455" /LENGTH=114 /DNA_ID=CAMNT_0007302307 /DNA_START=40 /DNA_END=384 /DNA_ORIENTATION=-